MKTYALFNDFFFKEKPFLMPEKLYRVVCQRANPRTKEYMVNLLKEKFPEAELIDLDQPHSDGQCILLYPDSIGLGWKKIENRLMCHMQEVTVLNGRGRIFKLTSSIHKKLLLHRFLEATFLPEILLMPFILFYGICMAIHDKFSHCKS